MKTALYPEGFSKAGGLVVILGSFQSEDVGRLHLANVKSSDVKDSDTYRKIDVVIRVAAVSVKNHRNEQHYVGEKCIKLNGK